jgi:hypothetical protein
MKKLLCASALLVLVGSTAMAQDKTTAKKQDLSTHAARLKPQQAAAKTKKVQTPPAALSLFEATKPVPKKN